MRATHPPLKKKQTKETGKSGDDGGRKEAGSSTPRRKGHACVAWILYLSQSCCCSASATCSTAVCAHECIEFMCMCVCSVLISSHLIRSKNYFYLWGVMWMCYFCGQWSINVHVSPAAGVCVYVCAAFCSANSCVCWSANINFRGVKRYTWNPFYSRILGRLGRESLRCAACAVFQQSVAHTLIKQATLRHPAHLHSDPASNRIITPIVFYH